MGNVTRRIFLQASGAAAPVLAAGADGAGHVHSVATTAAATDAAPAASAAGR